MSTTWTVERLDQLPEYTVIEWGWDGQYGQVAVRVGVGPERGSWQCVEYDMHETGTPLRSAEIIAAADPGSIHVASVPLAALANEPALTAAARAGLPGTDLFGAMRMFDAAIKAVTGGDQ